MMNKKLLVLVIIVSISVLLSLIFCLRRDSYIIVIRKESDGSQTEMQFKITGSDSIPQGTWVMKSSEGWVTAEYHYKDGKLYGNNYTFYPNGKIKTVTNYKEGLRNGAFRSFYDSGQKKCIGSFRNDSIFGEWTWYDTIGNLDKRKVYIEAKSTP